MTLDMKKIETLFEAYQEGKEFEEYKRERIENHDILSSRPFDEDRAKQQIAKLVNKYRIEINALALFSGNGRYVIYNAVKSPRELYDDLVYLDKNIALFALERKGLTYYLKETIRQVIPNNQTN